MKAGAVTVAPSRVSRMNHGSPAAAARARFVKKAPPGAYWANSTGCGVRHEGIREADPMVACGMGMVPEVSQRFLDFYVKG